MERFDLSKVKISKSQIPATGSGVFARTLIKKGN